ncbi:MAG: DNA cytosine methyltransferase [Pseudohongiellaceae bacterium]
MKVLDLFSGFGGFSLGLERAGMETVAFCEVKKYPRMVLAKNWPGIPIHEDIRELDGKQYKGAIDVVCGGFPCQDLSAAGAKRGITAARSGLYGEMLRVISECGPRFAIFENVTNLLYGDRGRWFARFLSDLANIGFDAEWQCIPASAVGANHKRERVWIVAYPKGNAIAGSIFQGFTRLELFGSELGRISCGNVSGTNWGEDQPGFVEVDDGLPNWVGSVSGYGNAVVPQIPELIGRAILCRS